MGIGWSVLEPAESPAQRAGLQEAGPPQLLRAVLLTGFIAQSIWVLKSTDLEEHLNFSCEK